MQYTFYYADSGELFEDIVRYGFHVYSGVMGLSVILRNIRKPQAMTKRMKFSTLIYIYVIASLLHILIFNEIRTESSLIVGAYKNFTNMLECRSIHRGIL